MLRLSTLASSEDLLEERSHKAVDDVGVVVDLGIMLDVTQELVQSFDVDDLGFACVSLESTDEHNTIHPRVCEVGDGT